MWPWLVLGLGSMPSSRWPHRHTVAPHAHACMGSCLSGRKAVTVQACRPPPGDRPVGLRLGLRVRQHGRTRRPGSGRATAEPAAHGSRHPPARARQGTQGCRAEPPPLGPRTAALARLRSAARRAGVAACEQPGHSLTYLLTYLPLTHSLRLLHQSGLRAAARSKWPLGSARARPLHPLRKRLRKRVASLSGSTPQRERPAHWVMSHCLRCSSQPPPKSAVLRPLSLQVAGLPEDGN